MVRNKAQTEDVFTIASLINTLATYNPWWTNLDFVWNNPSFKRDSFASGVQHLKETHGLALLINGPRRVGKTTLMRQLIEYLVQQKQVSPQRILFFSLDDPFIQQFPANERGAAFEKIIAQWEVTLNFKIATSPEPVYCFLDEVQRLPNWELYIKRYVDLQYPIRFVISGSASHTIFRKSLESLLGRLVEISLPPFTFREWVRYHQPEWANVLDNMTQTRFDINDAAVVKTVIENVVDRIGQRNLTFFDQFASAYARAGGFPQLWTQEPFERAQFVDLQYVQRVTLEDLRLIKEIRRPEIFHQFLRYAFARTGEEYNLEALATKIKTTRVTLSGALPLLLQTELIRKVDRFTHKPVRLRTTHAKLYATDTMLYEAITKVPADLDGTDKGRIAETLVYNTIRRFAGITDITYYRTKDGQNEIDFIVRVGRSLVPIEVKNRADAKANNSDSMEEFLKEFASESTFGIIVTRATLDLSQKILKIPLAVFLLLN